MKINTYQILGIVALISCVIGFIEAPPVYTSDDPLSFSTQYHEDAMFIRIILIFIAFFAVWLLLKGGNKKK